MSLRSMCWRWRDIITISRGVLLGPFASLLLFFIHYFAGRISQIPFCPVPISSRIETAL